MSDAGLVRLQALPNLTGLSLEGIPMTDAGMEVLKDLKAWPNLTILNLSHTQISDAGLKRLRGLTGLRELDLSGTKVLAEGVLALRKELPKCKVLTDLVPE